VEKVMLQQLHKMENCNDLSIKYYSITWGNPDQGKLGHSPKDQGKSKYSPRNYADYNAIDFVYGDLENKKVVNVACGFQHTVCVTEDGEVYSWGFGKNGALGHGDWE
jgi:alpha-tubulin suppressor-like RCC1 family protein